MVFIAINNIIDKLIVFLTYIEFKILNIVLASIDFNDES